MNNEGSALSDSVLAELSRQALAESAGRLGVDPRQLARSLGGGRIAELILVLRHARSWAYPSDRQRIEDLLEVIEGESHAAITGAARAGARARPSAESRVRCRT